MAETIETVTVTAWANVAGLRRGETGTIRRSKMVDALIGQRLLVEAGEDVPDQPESDDTPIEAPEPPTEGPGPESDAESEKPAVKKSSRRKATPAKNTDDG